MKNVMFAIMCGMMIVAACKNDRTIKEEDLTQVQTEVEKTLQQYHADIEREGILAELNYLDSSAEFSWFAPGYSGPIGYDSVVSILKMMAPAYAKVDHTWDSLTVIPESIDRARYIGYVTSVMTDTMGLPRQYRFKEDGIIVRRESGWRLLTGKTIELQ